MSNVSLALTRQAQQAAEELVAKVDSSTAILIATADGFDLAHAGTRSIDAGRLAAMVSSFAALGEAASRETQIGDPRCLVVESTKGRLVVRCFRVNGLALVVVLLTDTSVLLGLVWNHLATLERQLNAP